jgi:hypothetical protein
MNVFYSENLIDQSGKDSESEKPEDPRFLSQFSFVVFENHLSGSFNVGQTVNYSQGGVCFRTGTKLQSGTELLIGIGYNGGKFRTKVVWSKKNREESLYTIGVKYC